MGDGLKHVLVLRGAAHVRTLLLLHVLEREAGPPALGACADELLPRSLGAGAAQSVHVTHRSLRPLWWGGGRRIRSLGRWPSCPAPTVRAAPPPAAHTPGHSESERTPRTYSTSISSLPGQRASRGIVPAVTQIGTA